MLLFSIITFPKRGNHSADFQLLTDRLKSGAGDGEHCFARRLSRAQNRQSTAVKAGDGTGGKIVVRNGIGRGKTLQAGGSLHHSCQRQGRPGNPTALPILEFHQHKEQGLSSGIGHCLLRLEN